MDLIVVMEIVLVLNETIMVSVCDEFYWSDVQSYCNNVQNALQNLIFAVVLMENSNGLKVF